MDLSETNPRVIREFRAGGEVQGMQRDRLLLLSTMGRRTGVRRTTPMMFHRAGDRLFVMASNAGAPRHPDWYLNLVADPHVTVEVGDEAYAAIATPLAGAELDRVWAEVKRTYPFFADHEVAASGRTIPVVDLVAKPAGH